MPAARMRMTVEELAEEALGLPNAVRSLANRPPRL